MNNHRDAFERLLRDNPYDIASRLMFADWLEENGYDDEAVEQRRHATTDWCDAHQWMVAFAEQCGHTCENYGEGWEQYNQEIRGLDWDNKEDRQRLEEARQRAIEREQWRAITVDDCIHAGHDYLQVGNYFVQVGSELARTMMGNEKTAAMFWRNWSVITGVAVNDDVKGHGSAPFSCSC